MAKIVCKMCGGTIEVDANKTTAVCEYCDSEQTIVRVDDEKKANLFNRANELRINREFDAAIRQYEAIINDNPNEAEAYWGMCLSKYGIEYVEDPKTKKRKPTCNRAHHKSIIEDESYKKAIEYADVVAKKMYEEEAEVIDKIQKKIIALSQKEDPYDIFICYKETDDQTGSRTKDSLVAQQLYEKLTDKGYKVFYAKFTLESKAGIDYESNIFAALHSAKMMLVLGTKKEYFNAVWVKNEWARYLSIIENNIDKYLVPCYGDMNAYDMPMELAQLQALSLNDIDFLPNLLHRIDNIFGKNKKEEVKVVYETNSASTKNGNNDYTLIETMVEARNWAMAERYARQFTENDSKDYKAWLNLGVATAWQSNTVKNRFDEANTSFKLALKFCPKDEIDSVIETIRDTYDDICYAYTALISENIGDNYNNGDEIYQGYNFVNKFTNYCFLEGIYNFEYTEDEKNNKLAQYYANIGTKYIEAAVHVYKDDIIDTYTKPERIEASKPTKYEFEYFIEHILYVYQILDSVISESEEFATNKLVYEVINAAIDTRINISKYHMAVKEYDYNYVNGYKKWYVSKVISDSYVSTLNKKIKELNDKKEGIKFEIDILPIIEDINNTKIELLEDAEKLISRILAAKKLKVPASKTKFLENKIKGKSNQIQQFYTDTYNKNFNNIVKKFNGISNGGNVDDVKVLYNREIVELSNKLNQLDELRISKINKDSLNNKIKEFFKVLEAFYFENFPEDAKTILESRQKAENLRKKGIYDSNKKILEETYNQFDKENEFNDAIKCLSEIIIFENTKDVILDYKNKRKNFLYGYYKQELENKLNVFDAEDEINASIEKLNELIDFENVKEYIEDYKKRRANALEKIRKERTLAAKKKKFAIISIASLISAIIVFLLIFLFVIKPSMDYEKAVEAINNGDYTQAEELFDSLGDYKETSNYLSVLDGVREFRNGSYELGINYIVEAGGTVNVSFDANGGTIEQDSMVISSVNSRTINRITIMPDKDGYQFDGWEIEEFSVSCAEGITAELKLKASYVMFLYSIQYLGVTNQFASDLPYYYNIEDTIPLPNPEMKGYTFLGWKNDNSDECIKDYTISGEYGDKVLTAMWEGNKYTITFDVAGGVLDETSMEVVYGTTYSLPTPTKKGYTFVGWEGYRQNGTWETDKDVTIKAIYSPIEYTITYPKDSYSYDGTRVYSYTLESNTKIPNPTRTNYVFLGWTYEGLEEPTKDLTLTNVCENITLVAHWEGEKYTVTFDPNGGSVDVETFEVEYNKEYELPTPTREGYTFTGWKAGYNSVPQTGNWTYLSYSNLEAQWEATKYNIEYVLNGGENNNYYLNSYTYSETKQVAINNATKAGYTFLGWKVNDSTDLVENYTINAKQIGDIKLEAVWEVNDYTITFDVAGGEFDKENDIFTYDSTVILDAPEKRGHTFLYWSNSATGKTYKANEEFVFDISNNDTLTAVWQANVYKLTAYYYNDLYNQIIPITQNVTYGTYFSISSYHRYDGYNLVGFFTKENGEGELIVQDYTSLKAWDFLEDTILYGYYTYTITFVSNNGEENVLETVGYGQTIENIPTPEKGEFTFGGWYTDEKLTMLVDFEKSYNNIKVYAKWNEEVSAELLKFSYYSSTNEAYIYGTNSTLEGNIILPTYLAGNLLTEISKEAFKNQSQITSIIIPDTVTSLGEGAFEGCNSLVDITLPFVGSSIDDTNKMTNTLGHIFGYNAEKGGEYLTSESADFTTQNIARTSGAYTYYYSYFIPESLRNVTITVQKNIPNSAFRNCDFLEKITIPTDTLTIGSHAFYKCSGLVQFNSERDGLFNIPTNVTNINKSTFNGCSSVTEITMSNNITSIGDYGFKGCSLVEKINSTIVGTLNVPTSCETIGIDAFNGMALIDTAVVSNTVTSIGEGAFEGCINLTNLILPFVGSSIDDTNKMTNTLGHIFGYNAEKGGEYLTSESADFTTQNIARTSGAYTYYYSYFIPESLRNVTITVQKNIPNSAFRNCDFLEKITIPTDTLTIGSHAFYKCSGLVQFNSERDGLFNIPTNVVEINKSCFYGCSSATEITMSNDIISIGDYAFSGCSLVEKFNSNVVGTLNVPTSCENIGIDAFNGMVLITTANVDVNVTLIGDGAFEGCNSLVDITLPFVGSSLADTTKKTNTLGHIFGYDTTHSSTKTSSSYSYTTQASSGSSYYGYFIPDSLRNVTITVQKNIPDCAFRNCDLLTTITLLTDADTSLTYTLTNCSATVNKTLNEVANAPWDGSSVATSFTSGDGSKETPYLIYNGKELAYLKEQVNAGNSYEGTYFKLNNNIYLNGFEFGVIGNTLETPFAGNLNGNKYSIKNFTITSSDVYAGLFGYVTGNISNLALENVTITHTNDTDAKLYVGVLVGYLTGNIDNVYATGTLISTTKNDVYAGGLFGYLTGTVTNSYANVTVSLTSTNKHAYAGGLVGQVDGTITGSFAYGNVTAKGTLANLSHNGGLVGKNNGTITDSYRFSEQVLTKYTTKDSADNTDGIEVTLIEFYENVKTVWDLTVWNFERGYLDLPKYK